MSKSVPDKWLDYKSHGTVINGTKILPFKVPLKEGVCKNLQDEQRFTTAMLIKAFPNLKYIVDLTNTNRYYDNGDFSKVGVKYQKVMIPGIQVPSLEYVKRFFKAMEIFTKECKDDEIIGVHCTHGVNRTGYLICRYLVQQLGWKLNDALKEFKEARGHGIERTNYTTDLKRVPAGQKIDVSNVKLSTPVAKSKNPKNRSKRAGLRPPRPLFPMGPPRPMPPGRRNAFVNGGPPFPPGPPPPPPHFGPGPNTGFGPRHLPPGPPPLVPPVSRGPPPPPPPPMFGRPRAGRFGRMPPGPPMRSPPLPPPPPPRPMSGPPGMPPRMAPRLPPLLRQPVPPPLLPPVPLPVAKGPIRPLLRSGGRNQRKATKEQDFTADTFEENLAAKVPSRRRKRPYPGKR